MPLPGEVDRKDSKYTFSVRITPTDPDIAASDLGDHRDVASVCDHLQSHVSCGYAYSPVTHADDFSYDDWHTHRDFLGCGAIKRAHGRRIFCDTLGHTWTRPAHMGMYSTSTGQSSDSTVRFPIHNSSLSEQGAVLCGQSRPVRCVRTEMCGHGNVRITPPHSSSGQCISLHLPAASNHLTCASLTRPQRPHGTPQRP